MKNRGKLFLISAASGTGKSSLINTVLSRLEKDSLSVELSISHTTRLPRKDEHESKDYFFINRDSFTVKIKNNFFLEYAKVHDHYYGTSRSFVEEKLASGINLILEIDVQGVDQIKQLSLPSQSIFLLPPSLESLEDRLSLRGSNSPDSIKLRLQNAFSELPKCSTYDHIIINDDFYSCSQELIDIIKGEHKSPYNSKIQEFLDKLLS